jgi:RNA polymerase sigma-70 factor (ECF subfamily)
MTLSRQGPASLRSSRLSSDLGVTRSDMNACDAASIADCAAGDPTALDDLYHRHGGACLALARQILRDAHYAEDTVQEVFLHLWRNASAFDGSRSSARTWLMMLTHHRAVDRVRSEQRRAASALGEKDDHPDDRPGPEAQAITALLGERAVSALAVLTADKREALVLAYWGGYTQREIAVMTSTPLGTVKTRTRNALIQLHRFLADDSQSSARSFVTDKEAVAG